MKLMENNKTAVEWYWDKIKSHFEHDGDLYEVACMTYEIAKDKELAQRIDDYTNGHIDREKNLLRLPKRNTSSLPIDEDMTDWDVTLNDGLENL